MYFMNIQAAAFYTYLFQTFLLNNSGVGNARIPLGIV
jgi:hypothetical protein